MAMTPFMANKTVDEFVSSKQQYDVCMSVEVTDYTNVFLHVYMNTGTQ